MSAWGIDGVSGQTLLSRLQWNRLLEVANDYFDEHGRRMTPKPLESFNLRSDSLRQVVYNQLNPTPPAPPPIEPAFVVSTIEYIGPGVRDGWIKRFQREEWAFIGNTSLLPIDTLFTRDIRSRLEGNYGPPTVALGEEGIHLRTDSDESIEFEYWFVLNDAMPVILIDVNGPWDRGLVMSVPSKFRDILFDVKETFLGQLSESDVRMPFADYYFNPDQNQWYVTVYDGASFYDVRIDSPIPIEGRPELGSYLSSSIRSAQ